MKRLWVMVTVATLLAVSLCGGARAQDAKPGAEVAELFDLINKLRTDPAANASFINDVAKGIDENYRKNPDFAKNDKRDEKSSIFYFDALAANLKSRDKAPPLIWDGNLAAIAGEKGKARNRLFKPDLHTSQGASKGPEALFWWTSFGALDDVVYKLLDPKLQRIGIARLKGDEADSFDFHVVGSVLPGTAYTMTDADLAGRPFDARTDDHPVRDSASTHNLAPTLTPFVRADGSVDVAWKDQGSKPRVFVSRFSADGKKTMQVEVGAAEAADYPILAGFTEDPDGNLYVLKAKDEGDLDKEKEPATPKGTPEHEYDRPEVMKLWKLDSTGKELWAKHLEKDRGGASATFSPLSSNGNGKFGSTARLAYIRMRQPTYKLASDESIVVPPDVAEPGLLGYTTGDDGGKRSQVLDPKDQADSADGVFSPKASLILEKDWEKGFAEIPTPPDGSKYPVLFPDGTPNTYGRGGSFNPEKYAKFVEFVNANKVKWGDEGWQVPAAKLKLKGSAEPEGVIFAIYGSATDYDTNIGARHQQAYWRGVRADNGEAIAGKNGWAMGHCFDMHVLPTDEGVITVERSDIGIIAANYLRQPQSRGHKAYVFEHAWYDNDCFSELGSLAAATDGYAVLITSNRSTAEPVAISGNLARLNQERARPRDLAILRFKKGFSDDIDRVGKGGEYRSFPDPHRGKLPEGIITRKITYFTNYGGDGKFEATRPRMVRTGENEYVVVWERWTRRILPAAGDGGRLVEGDYDSTWAVKIDRDGSVLKPAARLTGTPRITRGDPALLFQDRCAWVTGDAIEKKLLLHTVDADLNYHVTTMDL